MQGIKGIGIALILVFMANPAFTSQDPSVLLEKAIYTEETLGKLTDAIAIYKEITSNTETTRTLAAQALYRLGVCYRKQGIETEALSTFSNLSKLYPEQKDLIAKSLVLTLKPAPWADGEVMKLTQNRLGMDYKTSLRFGTYTAESGIDDGKQVWNLRYIYGSSAYTVTKVEDATMLPIKIHFQSNQTDLEARYGPEKVEVTNLKDSSQPLRQIKSEGAVYDAWQIVPLLRRLPLKEGFQITIPLFESSTATSANVKFSVSGRETITVPAGTFDCYKVAMISDDSLPTNQTFWITADSHAYLAQAYLNRSDEFTLYSVEVVAKDQSLNIDIPGTEFGFSVPRQWFLSNVGGMPTYETGAFLGIAAPDVATDLTVTVYKSSPEALVAAQNLSSKIVKRVSINGMEQTYDVVAGSQEEVAVAGLTGQRFIFKTYDLGSGEDNVEYNYRLVSSTKIFTFSFRTKKDNFEKMRSSFESIMSSLRVK